MLDYGNAGAEQQRMGGPCPVFHIVDIDRIDSDQSRRGLNKVFREIPRHERRAPGISSRAPVNIPASPYQNGAITKMKTFKG